MDAATGIEYLKLNSSQVNGVSDQHEKSKKPVLEMWDDWCYVWVESFHTQDLYL